jgi:hypothetical protein
MGDGDAATTDYPPLMFWFPWSYSGCRFGEIGGVGAALPAPLWLTDVKTAVIYYTTRCATFLECQ